MSGLGVACLLEAGGFMASRRGCHKRSYSP